MDNVVDVLQTGFVRLVDKMGTDLTVVDAARVSFGKRSAFNPDGTLKEEDQKLLKFLAKEHHWTPYAHPQVQFHIKAPIFVRTQLFKHKVGLVENEISRRYVTDPPEFYMPKWRGKPTNGRKQGSSDFMEDVDSLSRLNGLANIVHTTALNAYETALATGAAPEQARGLLPQNMYTEWYWTGSLAAMHRVWKLRVDKHAQWETQQYAAAIGTLIAPLFPHSWEVLTSH